MKTTELLSWYFTSFLKKFWASIALIALLFIGAEIVQMCFFLFIKPLVDSAVYTKTPTVLMYWGSIYMGVIILNFCLSIVKGILFSKLRVRIEQTLQQYFYNHSLGIPPAIIFTKQSGYILQRMLNDVEGSLELFNQEILSAIGQVLSAIFLIWALFSLNAKLALIGLSITYPLFILNLHFIAPCLRPLAEKMKENYALLSAKIQETLQGVITIRAFGSEEYEKKLFVFQLASYLNSKLRFFYRNLLLGSGIPLLIYFPILGILVWLGINDVMRDSLSIGGFMSFILLFMFATTPLRGLSVVVSSLQPITASIGRLYEFYQYKPPTLQKKYQPMPENIECISFEEVSISYDIKKPILKNISLKIPRSKVVALVGHSGSGKTTVVNLLLGFLKPNTGRIKINNTELNDVRLEDWLKSIGLIEQDTFLFNRSIIENIRIARLDVTKEKIEDAAKKAGLYEFIMSLPNGFQTIVGERGFSISGGERQRIAIARVFLKSPPIIVMDEPTSALDLATEEKIIKELKSLSENRTVLVTTHRTSLLKMADFVYEIKEGEILNFTKTELPKED